MKHCSMLAVQERLELLELSKIHHNMVYDTHVGANVEGQPSARLLGLDV